MDLDTVTSLRPAGSRDDLRLAPGEGFLAGGTWLFSEHQDHLTGLVDLTTLGWEPWTSTVDGVAIASTCTIAQLLGLTDVQGARPALFRSCAEAFLMSAKIWRTATVGGNVCLALPAGAMISLLTALDAEALVWTPDGGERREGVVDLVAGVQSTTLAPGEVVRSFLVRHEALAAAAVFRRASLTSLGRSAAVVIARRDGDGLVLSITASTPRPHVLRFPHLPAAAELSEALDPISWYDDPHGAPDWREAVTRHLAAEACQELGA
ncbi:FAD binding domain-containing protein [Aeromicrobium alkaliterrae]|uniref:FAD binding domain-containing protein n=1 Tax=Aeromicrobium alkaliterrae TaxID=302168 RepID=A0ABP4W1B2_9ACTN